MCVDVDCLFAEAHVNTWDTGMFFGFFANTVVYTPLDLLIASLMPLVEPG